MGCEDSRSQGNGWFLLSQKWGSKVAVPLSEERVADHFFFSIHAYQYPKNGLRGVSSLSFLLSFLLFLYLIPSDTVFHHGRRQMFVSKPSLLIEAYSFFRFSLYIYYHETAGVLVLRCGE